MRVKKHNPIIPCINHGESRLLGKHNASQLLRLQALVNGGAPYSILSTVDLVMRHMTRPDVASCLQPKNS